VQVILFDLLVVVILFALIAWKDTRDSIISEKILVALLLTTSLTTTIATGVYIDNVYSFNFTDTPSNYQSSIDDNNGDEFDKARIAFFNKLYDNKRYSLISETITESDPDIIALAEFTTDDLDEIAALENYPYRYEKISRTYEGYEVGLSLYSKDLLQVYELDMETRKELRELPIIHAVIDTEVSDDPINLIAVHTTAPVIPSFYARRNEQLQGLSDYINELPSEAQKNLVLIGDFNLSPWSPQFRTFTSDTKSIVNAAQGQGLYFSWSYDSLPLFYSHIDHIFISKQLSYNNFRSATDRAGSDHYLIYVDIYGN
jgi:endonuclease/exonuclease/phosphatase family metal-dependent hydrolase